MPFDPTMRLLDWLRSSGMLSPSQLEECTHVLPVRFPEPRALAGELIQRGWLTPYQVNRLFQDKGDELILGPYLLLERLGEGGMGTVFKARHQLMGRIVALKIVRKERLSRPDDIRRFQREIQAAARLSHPNIVLAYDADQIGDRFFFVMEYVEGTDLSKLIRKQGPLPLATACDYTRQAALGLQHAHEQGLVHRDIKPANLLVTSKGSAVKVLDLGLARLDHSEDSQSTDALTHYGTVMGTPDFMAPEQAANPHGTDIRADIYSLGCTLYAMLTGKVPFPGGSFMEKLFRHKEIDPVPVEVHRREVNPGLAAVVKKMMAKQREARYQTPAEAAMALLPFCGDNAAPRAVLVTPAEMGEPSQLRGVTQSFNLVVDSTLTTHAEVPQAAVAVKPDQAMETCPVAVSAVVAATPMKQRRRLPRWKLGLALGVVLLGCGLILALAFQGKKDTPSRIPDDNQANGGSGGDAAERLPVGIEPQPLDWKDGDPLSAMALVSRPAAIPGVRGWTIETRNPRGHVWRVAWSPDGRLLAGGVNDGTVRLWDSDSGRLVRVLVGHGDAVRALAWSPDGRLLASASADASVRVWEPRTGRLLRTLMGHTAKVLSLAWSPDGKRLASGGQDSLRMWDVVSGQTVETYQGGNLWEVIALSWSPDGKTLAAGGKNHRIELWDVESSRLRRSLTTGGEVGTVAWSPDSKELAAGGNPNLVLQRWDAVSGRELSSFKAPPNIHNEVAWSPDGQLFASAAHSGVVLLWEAQSRKPLPHLQHSFGKHLFSLNWSPDSKRLASSSYEGTVLVWDVAARKSLYSLSMDFPFYHEASVAWSPDGKRLVCSATGFTRPWDGLSGKPLPPWSRNEGRLFTLAWSPDSKTLASSSDGGSVQLWDASSGRIAQKLPHPYSSHPLAWSPDGAMLVYLGPDDTLRLWDARAGKPLRTLKGHDGVVLAAAWSPNGQVFATASVDTTIRLWNGKTFEPLRTLRKLPRFAWSLAWSPDSKTLVSAGMDGLVGLWDAATGDQFAALKGHRQEVHAVAWSPDGKWLASAALDGTVILWEGRSGKLVRSLDKKGGGGVRYLTWSPDSTLLAASGDAGEIVIWQVAEGRQLARLLLLDEFAALTIGADGHYRGTPRIEKHIVYVVRTNQGQETLSPEEFARKYHWKNDPERVHLLAK